MSGWDDFLKEINKEKEEQPAETTTQNSSSWDSFLNEINSPQSTPVTTSPAPVATSQEEPFQLRMAKAAASEKANDAEARDRISDLLKNLPGQLGAEKEKTLEEKRADQQAADKEFRNKLWNMLGLAAQNAQQTQSGVQLPVQQQIEQTQRQAQAGAALAEAKRKSDEATAAFDKQGFFQRQGHEISGWGQRTAGNLGNTLLTLGDAYNQADARMQAYDPNNLLISRMLGQDPVKEAERQVEARTGEEARAAIDKAYSSMDAIAERGNEELQRAKDGASALGRLGLDLETGALDLGADALANAVAPGAGMVSMGARVFGEAAREERQNGGDIGQQMLAGTKAAAIEVLTEKISGPFEKIYGKSLTGKAINKAVDAIESKAGRAAVKMLSDALGEGAEEILSDLLNPVADYALGLADSWDEAWSDTTLEGVLYDGMLGSLLGMAGSAGNIIRTKGTITPADIQQIEEAGQVAGEQAMRESAESKPKTDEDATSGSIAQENIVAPPAQENAPVAAPASAEVATEETPAAPAENPATETEAAQTAPEQTATQPTAAAETGIAPVEPSGENGTVTGEEIALPGMKRSQTESNTLSGVADKLGGEQNPLYYMPVTERQTLAEAVNRVQADGVGEMERLAASDHWSAADVDTAMTLYGKLQADGVKNRDFSAAQSWAKVIQSRGTSTAQALQAFSKWTRSGSGTATAAQEQLTQAVEDYKASDGKRGISQEKADQITNDLYDFAQEFDSLPEDDTTGTRDLIKKMSDYRNTGTFVKSNFTKLLDSIDDADYLREYALRQMSAIADDATVEADLGQKLKTMQVNSMLTSIATFIRNIGGNQTFGTIDTLTQDGLGVALDYLISKKTGNREVGFDKGWFSSKARKGATEAMRKSALEIAGDVNMSGKESRYGTSANRTFKMNGSPIERFFSRWEQLNGYSLQTSDAFFRGKLEASQAEGLENAGVSQEASDELSEAMADYRLFQNKGKAYGISKGAHDILNLLGVGGTVDTAHPQYGRQGGFGVGDMTLPFPGVPANLGVKALEYSPANVVKGTVEFVKLLNDIKMGNVKTGQQQQAVMDIARGMVGVPIIAALAAAFKSGVVKNNDDEDDLDEAAQDRAEGRTGVQINLSAWKRGLNGESTDWRDGDDLMSVGWLEPINAFMAIASLIAQDESEDASLESYAKKYYTGALQSVLEMPVMQSISDIVNATRNATADNLSEKMTDAAISFGGNALTGFVPRPVSALAKALDPYQRDTREDTAGGQVLNKLMEQIPGLREMLDVRTDAYGNPQSKPDSIGTRILNEYVLPGRVGQLKQTDTSAAMKELYEATGIRTAPDRKAPNSVKADGETTVLTTQQKKDWEKTYGKTYEKTINEMRRSGAWDSLTDEQKADVVSTARERARASAQSELLGKTGEEAQDKISKLEDPSGYLTARQALTSAIDGDDYATLDKLLQPDGVYDNLSEDAKEMLSSIDGLTKLVSMRDNGLTAEKAMDVIDARAEAKKAKRDGKDLNQAEDVATIVGMDLTDKEKMAAIKSYTSESFYEKTQAALDTGISLDKWSEVYSEKQRINDKDLSNSQKGDEFASYLSKDKSLTEAQRQLINDQLAFYNSQKYEPKKFEALVDKKIDEDVAVKIVDTMRGIQKNNEIGKAVVDMGEWASERDQWKTLETYASESYYNNAAEAYRRGIDLDDFVTKFDEADLPNDEGKKDGSLSQKELYQFYMSDPNNETFVKVMWMIGGFKTDWDTYKRKHG